MSFSDPNDERWNFTFRFIALAVIGLASLAVLLTVAGMACAQWGPGGCGPVGPNATRVFPAFRPSASPRPVAAILLAPAGGLIFRAGYPCSTQCTCGCNEDGPCPCKQLPAKVKDAEPKAKASAKCGCVCDCPCGESLCRCSEGNPCTYGCPCRPAEALIPPTGELSKENPNKGLCADWLNRRGPEVIYLGTQKITLTEGLGAIEGVPDFRSKLRLTAIGPPEFRATVQAEARAAGLLELCLFTGYSPEAWQLNDRDGNPAHKAGASTVYVQAADGKVLHRQDDYRGPDDLKAVVGALRKPQPYNTAKDPDLRKPSGPSWPVLLKLPDWFKNPWLWAIAVITFLFLKRK